MGLKNFPHRIPVAIFGANGYAGLELTRLLLKHPAVDLKACFTRNAEWSLADAFPEVDSEKIQTLQIEKIAENPSQFETVFLTTPHEVSIEISPLLIQAGVQVIDLSGAFRLNPTDSRKYYGTSENSDSLRETAHYGLMPWAETKSTPSLISNPGCYATSILMALIPLLKGKIIQPETLVIDSKSGSSGAGLKAREDLLFTEIDGDCLPYRIGDHPHLPEIIRYASFFSGVEINPHFSTSLLPVRRGIISGLYAMIHSSLSDLSQDEILSLIDLTFEKAYQKYPLVKFGRLASTGKIGGTGNKNKTFLSLKRVVGTCRSHISYTLQGSHIYIFSTLDNLLKGAASQAIENWNATHGFSLEMSLTDQLNTG